MFHDADMQTRMAQAPFVGLKQLAESLTDHVTGEGGGTPTEGATDFDGWRMHSCSGCAVGECVTASGAQV